MKKVIIILFILFWLFLENISAQVNLVPNNSFEDTVNCPQGFTQIWDTKYWRAGLGSVDYFNECAVSQVGIPINDIGYQFANTGTAYIGLLIFHF